MKCNACSADLSEKDVVLHKVSDEQGREKPLAVYTCPTCDTSFGTLPTADELRVWALLAQGAVLQARARFQEALGCFEYVLPINPRFAMAWYNKGCILSNLRRFPEAVECYDEALAIDPKYAEAWHYKGKALWVVGRTLEALECYDRALAINSQDILLQHDRGTLLARLRQV